ncbi:Arsenical pump membrane protein [Tritrichomonas foetus]|uniref:Arsenical pump membrane protein n=1 Tax=Tritrichomonas foetus TaxID=1144522 RepID=A0A1J4JM70_9EUKA|nr:Arsenical pump membrane protein [Tritrichomonas foetus]|eukprot:OHS98659.1 Arsenical pump membrane protein [Tritrichomonas foetus]
MAPEYTSAIIIFAVAIVLMLVCAVFFPVINIKLGKVQFGLETYFIFPFIAAIIVIAAKIIDPVEAGKGLWEFSGLNPVGILILFFSMVYISKFLDTTGFFEFTAIYSLSKSGDSSKKLYFIIYAVVSILTIFTSNDVVILTFTPFIHYFSKLAGISPIPFLFAEFFAANTWSMIFIISNPTNVVLGTAFKQSFSDFAKVMTPASIAGGLSNCFVLYLLFHDSINQRFNLKEDLGDPWARVKSKVDMYVSIAFTIIAIILLAVSSSPGFKIEMWMIAGIMACVLLVYNIIIDIINRKKPEKSKLRVIFASLPYPIIPFLLSLFVLVNTLKHKNFFIVIGNWIAPFTASSKPASVIVFGLFSTIAANILNNIPMSVAFAPIIQATTNPPNLGSVYAAVVGSNIGANLTPLGALAGLMWLKILKERDISIRFVDFLKVGLVVTPFCLAVTSAVVSGMSYAI